MDLTTRIQITPFFRILPCFVAGILALRWVEAPDWMIVVAAGVCYVAAWLFYKRRGGALYVAAAIFTSGMLLAMLSQQRCEVPRGQRLCMVVETERDPAPHGRWWQTEARVVSFRTDGDSALWHRAHERIMLYVDTAYRFSAADRLAVVGVLRPIDPSKGHYATLMHSRGMDAKVYVRRSAVVARDPEGGRSSVRWAAAIHRWAVARVDRLPMPDDEREILSAMLIGEKRTLDASLRHDYSRTGVAHILAVSGLHTGFVLLIANLLLGWLVFLRRGHTLRNVAVIALLWLYALMTGLAPSVVRAALMLSAAQLAMARSAASNRYNIVLGVAMVMLAIRPTYLFDMSFQLSFAAVLAILFFYPRMYRSRLSRPWWVDALLKTLFLGLAAQIGTTPLIAYYFGVVSIASVWVNPVVVGTAFVAVASGFVWLLLPFAWSDLLYGPFAGWVLRLQNGAVQWAASTRFAALEQIYPTAVVTVFAYLFVVLIGVWLKYREVRRNKMQIR